MPPFAATGFPRRREFWVSALSLMKFTEGGFTWADIMDLYDVDFIEALDAAEDLTKRLARK